ncbi:hypothetical protein B0H63DRAFT_519840 [Podospora didyma]|uniref:Uncharacterized protein n=1 Tax=Podospora didyma TaxID=330526 RepID=A0AAE0NZL0_9PEZI|nr:hypothetical protein B0H63DRAFT_519840 [Podospora didyma]
MPVPWVDLTFGLIEGCISSSSSSSGVTLSPSLKIRLTLRHAKRAVDAYVEEYARNFVLPPADNNSGIVNGGSDIMMKPGLTRRGPSFHVVVCRTGRLPQPTQLSSRRAYSPPAQAFCSRGISLEPVALSTPCVWKADTSKPMLGLLAEDYDWLRRSVIYGNLVSDSYYQLVITGRESTNHSGL